MNQLHAYFTLHNQKAFRQALDRGPSSSSGQGQSTSGPKSWTWQGGMSSTSPPVDVNAKDYLGRTVLHLACASNEASAFDYVRMLLGHSAINVSVQDTESRYTALHRALYAGNLSAAILLLQRADIDVSLKDYEGYTAFDLYNSTVEGTRPNENNADGEKMDMFTWGANRNAALGLGDGDDRAFPELVIIPSLEDRSTSLSHVEKLRPVQVKEVAMSKLHTVAVTVEPKGNLRLCGFGNGGRLGPGHHTQYNLVPLQQFDQPITTVALGQDHTLALTKAGTVLSWGLNRFSQLGYVVEVPPTGRSDEPIQPAPRRVVGLLKKEIVRGVAACKTASVCWTNDDVFTWGTNNGQLGYAEHVQVLPRKVSSVTDVISVSITDSAMACLLINEDVLCFMNNRSVKISFPIQRFRGDFVYPVHGKPNIAKIVSCENSFAALSQLGDVYHWTVSDSTSSDSKEKEKDRGMGVKPQLIWERRSQFSAVADVSLGSDGGMIICTQSGHVFVRYRNLKALSENRRQQGSGVSQSATGKAFKFNRVPYLQRVVQVCTNSTGAFAALRLDAKFEPIDTKGNTLAEDLADVQPFIPLDGDTGSVVVSPKPFDADDNDIPAEGDVDDAAISRDIKYFILLCSFLSHQQSTTDESETSISFSSHGADLVFALPGLDIPAHRVIVAARCPVLYDVMRGHAISEGKLSIRLPTPSRSQAANRLAVMGCQPLTILLLLQYLYTDDISSFWDRRVGLAVETQCASLGIKPATIKAELQALAQLLKLKPLSDILTSAVKRSAKPTLQQDFEALFSKTHTEFSTGTTSSTPLSCDICLELADRDVACYSAILRARSQFFASFFDDEDWTVRRWDSGVLRVNMKHMEWRPLSFVLAFLCYGKGVDMFDSIDFVKSTDEFIDFIFSIMVIANELLLDTLILICSSVILRHVTVANVCSVLADATYLHAPQLIKSLHGYMAMNMECLLEGRLLDDLAPNLFTELAKFVRDQQAKKLPVSKSNKLVDQALLDHADWLALQDIPQPIIRASSKHVPTKASPKISPTPTPSKPRRSPGLLPLPSPVTSPALKGRENAHLDGLFTMDEDPEEAIPALNLSSSPPASSPVSKQPQTARAPSSPWKAARNISGEKVDLKSIMAAESSRAQQPSTSSKIIGFSVSDADTPSNSPQWRARPGPKPFASEGDSLRPRVATTSSSGPWNLPTPPLSKGSHDRSAFPPIAVPSQATAMQVPPECPTPTTPVTRTQPLKPLSTPPLLRTVSSSSQLGPVITPLRASPIDSAGKRRVTSDAWTAPPISPPKSLNTPSTSGASFASIQQQQKDQALRRKNKQSLLEIQQEEESLQAEVDFMKWWTGEEERLKSESAGGGGSGVGGAGDGGRGKRGRGGKTGRGGGGHGRGGGGAQRGGGGGGPMHNFDKPSTSLEARGRSAKA